ncbi:toll/interleukin-1 receptor domain-containing protein [Mycolicibacterium brisbanense]|uniref:TIR domain-containing protein n=1 Tax=Mycolicibacterium brisbanense TaxID=146020 RepID=A0A124E0J7_9MYCO|nr:toll/interleukin-1 receptor domain-containing protein [Mycolicibacterium brisbanense]MCV7156471.1 toll/interleukin-1 receptor domain-containing protein [Mycolicibacterium brisbanense]GAS90710.1 uncharacterized protein RMCB_4806 [Mycolicibacterium brisbanense]
MAVTYQIQMIQVDRKAWSADLRSAIENELRSVGVHLDVTVEFTGSNPDPRAPSVAVVLAGPAAKDSDKVKQAIVDAIRVGRVVIPVVEDLTNFHEVIPVPVAHANGFEWSGDRPERRLARVLLEELGIEDRNRRVFISHKREDGLGAAEQLHDQLAHHRFVPFIDRFAVPPGDDVQAHIADALESYAFLLLLETPEAHRSKWVFDEVDYALSHQMGLQIVRWPDDPKPIPGSGDLPRITLSAADLATDAHGYDVLTPTALDRVIHEVEKAHAHALVRRRRYLVRSVEDAARGAGATCIPLRHWSLDVMFPTRRSIVGVTPRTPAAEDLQRIDQTRTIIDPDARAMLVHTARYLRENTRTHLEWIIHDRDLHLIPDNAVGGAW